MKSHNLSVSTYPGGKGKCFHHIINVMPPHKRYIETHLGAGAVMRHKRPAAENIGIEIDPQVVARWKRYPMPGVRIFAGDALKVIADMRPGPGDLLYCDPPYLPEARKREVAYRYDYLAEDHERLLMLLKSFECHIVLSGYASRLYERELHNWSKHEFRAQTQAGPVTETLWTNFEPGPVLHDYSYIGAGFRERERLRRRVTSLADRLSKAPSIELNAALANLADVAPNALLIAAERLR